MRHGVLIEHLCRRLGNNLVSLRLELLPQVRHHWSGLLGYEGAAVRDERRAYLLLQESVAMLFNVEGPVQRHRLLGKRVLHTSELACGFDGHGRWQSHVAERTQRVQTVLREVFGGPGQLALLQDPRALKLLNEPVDDELVRLDLARSGYFRRDLSPNKILTKPLKLALSVRRLICVAWPKRPALIDEAGWRLSGACVGLHLLGGDAANGLWRGVRQ